MRRLEKVPKPVYLFIISKNGGLSLLKLNFNKRDPESKIYLGQGTTPKTRRRYYGLASSLILSSAMTLPILANAVNLTVNEKYTLSPGSYSYDELKIGADSTLKIKGNTTISVKSLVSKTGATISGLSAKSLTLTVEDGSGIEALSIIGTGLNGDPGSNGSGGSKGRDAYIKWFKCHSAKSGSTGGSGTPGAPGENGMFIRVRINNLNPNASLNIESNGGTGGRGGNGGTGGTGGKANHACTSGGDGGRGGNAGVGGDGGDGGIIMTMLTYSNDATQEDIDEGRTRLTVTHKPGEGGNHGTPGAGGKDGDGRGLGWKGFVYKDGSKGNGGSGTENGADGADGKHTELQVLPSAPSEPSPQTGSEDIDPSQNLELTWKPSTDSNGDTVTYTVYFGTDQLCSDLSPEDGLSCTIPEKKLEFGKSYFWQVEAKDGHNNNTVRSELWSFQIKGNEPPSNPTNPVIKNGGNEIDPAQTEIDPKLSGEFSWTASEDPEGEQVLYKVCHNKVNEETIKCYPKTSETSETFDQLDYGASYEWRVVAEDSSGNKAEWYSNEEELEKWTFRTEAAPAVIKLTANSGYANTLLDWDTDATGIIEYRVLRVLHPEGSDTIPEFSVDNEIDKTPNLQYTDADLSEGQYCYRVEGLDANGEIVSSSVYNKQKVCVAAGEVTLAIESISGTTTGEVPIEMPNGGNLQISTADICFKYDPDVLRVTNVTTTAFSNGYKFNFDPETFIDLGILKIQIEANEGGFGEPAPVMGPGALADVSFAVNDKKDRGGKDYSDLEWFKASENEDLVNQPGYEGLKNCIMVRDDNNKPVELGLRDGSFTVRKGSRDGQRTTQARFYVREAYSKGDVDGDGIVSTADARMATGIGVGYYPMTQDRRSAADFNSDEKINAADAIIISHYALHQEWLDNDKPPVEGPKTRKLRDGKDTPITFRIGEISSVSGSEVTTTLSVDNLTDMTAMNLAIAYNTAVVKKAKVKKTGLAADASLLYYDNKKGTVRISLNSEQPINGSGVIAEITLTLVSGGSVKSTPLVIAKTNLYDKFSRDFVTSALQRQIEKQHGKLTITDIEEPVVEDRAVVTPIEAILPVGSYGAACKVSDQDGNPIVDVTVKVGYKTVITDESGYCTIIGLVAGEYPVKATKDGYVFLETQCVVGDGQNCRLDIVNVNGEKAAPAKCQVYAVHDDGLNRSQFVTIGIDEHEIRKLGPMYRGYDIEALAIDPRTNIIYAASGNNVTNKYPKGHFYVVDGESGELFPVGGIGFGELYPVGSTGFEEIGDLTFSQDGTLWAWAKGDGLITIDITTGKGTSVFASDLLIEGLTLLEEGNPTFYGAVNTELWYYDTSTGALEIACTNLPGETEAIKGISAELFLISIHGGQIFAFNPQTCELGDAISTNEYNDVEGIALPVAACTK